MAAQYMFCTQCQKRHSTHQKLFETLYEFEKHGPADCPECGAARELQLTLDFQLGAGDSEFKVVSASLPDKLESWLGPEEEEVTFYPFLIVLQRLSDSRRFCWMPYWHITGKEARYGQHAICLDQSQFVSLIEQVQEKMEEQLLQPV